MDEQLDISSETKEGTSVLTVSYRPSQMFTEAASKLLSERLIEEYRSLLKGQPQGTQSPAVCVVSINSSTAGSSLVRALFDLYKVVQANSGTLICAGYPEDYMPSLTSLGLTVLPGFKLAATVEEALQKAREIASTA
jgi:hypothetical protein